MSAARRSAGASRDDPQPDEPVDPALPMRHAAEYRVRFDEATPRGLLRGSALLGYVQDVAWRHSEAIGFPRAVVPREGRRLARAGRRGAHPRPDRGRRDRHGHDPAHRLPQGHGAPRDRHRGARTASLRAVVLIDWAMTDGRAPGPDPGRVRARADRRPRAVRADPGRPPADARPTPTRLRFSPRLRELDPMNHANNGVYLDWLDEAVAAAGADGEAPRSPPSPARTAWSTCARPSPARPSSRPPGATTPAGPTAWPTRTARTSCGAGSARPDEPRPTSPAPERRAPGSNPTCPRLSFTGTRRTPGTAPATREASAPREPRHPWPAPAGDLRRLG